MQLPFEIGKTSVPFVRLREIARRSTTDRGRHIRIGVAQPIAATKTRGLVGETRGVQGVDQEAGGLVAREYATGSISAVRGRSESDHYESSFGISKARHCATPVGFAGILSPLFDGHTLPEGDQPGTATAFNDFVGDLMKRISRRSCSVHKNLGSNGGGRIISLGPTGNHYW
jgi:hypothetical protein